MSERQESGFAGQDVGTRIAAVSHARDVWLYRLIVWWSKAKVRLRHKRHLASLSDRQLHDAGIDLSLAGRGRASAARIDPNLEGLR